MEGHRKSHKLGVGDLMLYECIVCKIPSVLRKKSKREHDTDGKYCIKCWRDYLHQMCALGREHSIPTRTGVVSRILLNDIYIYLN